MFYATHKENNINFSFNCDSSNVEYLLVSSIFGLQYVGSTDTPFILRFSNCKACNRRFLGRVLEVPQDEIFRNFAGEGHQGFSEDVRVTT